jgi:hypothetical protein
LTQCIPLEDQPGQKGVRYYEGQLAWLKRAAAR